MAMMTTTILTIWNISNRRVNISLHITSMTHVQQQQQG
jgi:hypothetical protein